MRNNHRQEIIKAFTEAQKIAFAPLMFQAVSAMLELGILKEIDRNEISEKDLCKNLKLSEYTVSTLTQAAESMGIIEKHSDKFSITPMGKAFLYDEMTRVNFNFVKDVCFEGSAKLTDSFKTGMPEGLRQFFPQAKTIYPHIPGLPDKMRQSWYEFDHYYSDNCFDIIYKIVEKSPKIFDIGGNTGKFERLCLKNNPDIDITMIDLPQNIDFIRNDAELKGCKFYSADILDENSNLPQISGSVIMSQFLDCFSKEQIEFILKRIKNCSSKETRIYILEPFIDKQKFEGAKLSLVHTSLYFTCMANGCSKMYTISEMEELIKKSGLRLDCVYEGLGAHDYTLLECING